jgi:drug/metabolite transporter (DMT)-like permease
VTDRSDPVPPFVEGTPSSDAGGLRPASPASRWAFPAVILGNVALAFGPWLVRLAGIGPVASGFWRMAIALPFLIVIASWSSGWPARRPSRGLVLALLLAGACFALDLSTWHSGILRTRLANATLFGNVTSFFFAAYGFVVARRWPARGQGAALLLAAVGVGLLLGRSYHLSPDQIRGDLLCLFAGLAYTGYMIAIERARATVPTWPLLAAATAVTATLLLPAALTIDGAIWPRAWGPLLALAIGSQVIGQGLIVFGIGALPPVVVGLSLLCQPVVAATIGWIVYGETLTLPDFCGAGLIAAALVLVRRRPAR